MQKFRSYSLEKGLDLALARSRSRLGLGRENERLGLVKMWEGLGLVSSRTEKQTCRSHTTRSRLHHWYSQYSTPLSTPLWKALPLCRRRQWITPTNWEGSRSPGLRRGVYVTRIPWREAPECLHYVCAMQYSQTMVLFTPACEVKCLRKHTSIVNIHISFEQLLNAVRASHSSHSSHVNAIILSSTPTQQLITFIL